MLINEINNVDITNTFTIFFNDYDFFDKLINNIKDFKVKITIKKIIIDYKDVTNEWLNKSLPNEYNIGFSNKVISKNGKIYKLNNNSNFYDFSDEEILCAKTINNYLGGIIKHNFVVNKDKNISIADFTYTNKFFNIENELLELKTPKGKTHTTIYNRINNSKNQASMFVVDIKNMNCFSDNENLFDIRKIMLRKKWIKTIIVIKNNKILKIFSRI